MNLKLEFTFLDKNKNPLRTECFKLYPQGISILFNNCFAALFLRWLSVIFLCDAMRCDAQVLCQVVDFHINSVSISESNF